MGALERPFFFLLSLVGGDSSEAWLYDLYSWPTYYIHGPEGIR